MGCVGTLHETVSDRNYYFDCAWHGVSSLRGGHRQPVAVDFFTDFKTAQKRFWQQFGDDVQYCADNDYADGPDSNFHRRCSTVSGVFQRLSGQYEWVCRGVHCLLDSVSILYTGKLYARRKKVSAQGRIVEKDFAKVAWATVDSCGARTSA